jgi:fructokinase
MEEKSHNEHAAAIGIDLGGTKTESVLLSPDDSVLLRRRRPTPRDDGYDAIVVQVAEMVREAAAKLMPAAPYSVGIGIPGALDPVTGLVRNANSTCLIGRPFKADLEKLLGHPVEVRNDADCFTLAECSGGAGQGFDLVFGVIMGTGCGGGIWINGAVREGPHRIAGEWGHHAVDPHGAECYCGNRGCVETLISGSGVEAAFLREFDRRMSMDEIVARARVGDRQCGVTFKRFLDDFGRCLGGLISILDPDAVVLGGGLSNIDELYDVGVERIRHYVFHEGLRTPILKNRLGDSAGVFGAAWIGRSCMPSLPANGGLMDCKR